MDEQEIKLRLKTARENIQNKNFKDASKICEEILKTNPKNYTSLVFAGRCQVELNNPTSARDFYGRAVATDETQILAWQGFLQFYEKYGIWDENSIACLRKLIALTSDETKKRDYKLQLATVLAKAQRLSESASEFLALSSTVGDEGWKIQYDEAIIRYMGDSVLPNDEAIELVKNSFGRNIDRATGGEKITMQAKFVHFMIQNRRIAEAYEAQTTLGVSKDYGVTYLCDFVSILCDRYIQGTLNETDEEFLSNLNECFEEDSAISTGKDSPRSTAALSTSALLNAIDQNWSDVIDELEAGKLRASKNPFLWYLLAEAKFRMHDYLGSVAAAEEAQRHWQDSTQGIHRLKAAIIEANCRLEIGTSASLKRAMDIYRDALSKLENADLKRSVQLSLARTMAADGSKEEALDLLNKVADKSTADFQLVKATVHLKFGEFDECQAVVDGARAALGDTEEDEIKAKFHYIRGRILWDRDNDKSSAMKQFLQAGKLDSCHADSFYYIGLAYDQMNDQQQFAEKALKCFERAYALEGRHNWRYGSALSDAYRKSGAHEKNLVLLLEITNSQPADTCSWAWLRLGLEYLSEGKADDAVRVLQTVLRLVEDDVRCWECLGEAYAMRGSYASAVKTFERLVELETEAKQIVYAKYRMATINLLMQRYETAARGFEDVLALEPKNLSSTIGLGHSLVELTKFYFSEARYQRSLDVCVRAMDVLAPIVVFKQTCTSGWYLLGSSLTLVNRFPIAALVKMKFPDFRTMFNDSNINDDQLGLLRLGSRCFAQAIQLQPKVAQIWHDLGLNLYFQASCTTNETDVASEIVAQSVNCLKHAIQLEPTKANYWSTLANVAASDLVDQSELAQHCFIKSLSLEPHQAAAWTGLGVLYKKFDEIQMAHKCFERAQSIDPDYANCWIGQATIAEEVHPQEALDLFRHALELGNNPQGFLGYGYHVLLTMLDSAADRSSSEYQYAIEHLRAIPMAQVALQKYCLLNPTDPCALNISAVLMEQEGLYSNAASAYSSSLEMLKKSTESTDDNAEEFVMGNMCRLFGKMGNSAMMRKLAGKMTTRDTFDNLCMRGLAYYRLDQFDKASELYLKAIYASGTKLDEAMVDCALGLIAAKEGDWKKSAQQSEKSTTQLAPQIFWKSIGGLLETGTLDMRMIRRGFSQLAEIPTGNEWINLMTAVCCLYCEKFTLIAAQWLLHMFPFDCNVRFVFDRLRHRTKTYRIGITTSETDLPSLAKWKAMVQLKEHPAKDRLYAKIKHTYPDIFT